MNAFRALSASIPRERPSMAGPGPTVPRWESVLVGKPDRIDALFGLGMAAMAQGRRMLALRWLSRAANLDPGHESLRATLCGLLAAIGRHQAVEVRVRQALAARPADAGLYLELGNALALLNRPTSAIAACRAALLLRPDSADCYGNLGNLLHGSGHVDQALHCLDRAVRLAPDGMRHWYNLAQAKAFTRNDRQLVQLRQWGQNSEFLPEPDRVHLHFALAKAFDDIGEVDAAFSHSAAANRIRRRLLPYDEAAVLALLHTIGTAFSAELLAAKRGLGHPSAVPLFVIGMPRSGCTLVSQLLAAHPDCVRAGETLAMGLAFAETAPGSALATYPVGLTLLDKGILRQLAERYLQELATVTARPGAARVIDQLPANGLLVGLIHLALPNARFIHVRRDPRDCCLSAFFQNFESAQRHNHDLAELGRYWRAYERLMAVWAGLLPADRLLRIDYEDLVADFPRQARRLLVHAGLSWFEGCLDFHRNHDLILTASAAQVHRPLYGSSVGRWRRYAHLLTPLIAALEQDQPGTAGCCLRPNSAD